jgi:hypothetical protein
VQKRAFFLAPTSLRENDSLSSARRYCADISKTDNKESHALKEEVDVISLL